MNSTLLTQGILKHGGLLDTLIEQWNNRASLGASNRSREELAFLPAALEIQDTPPHPLAYWFSRTVMALFVFLVLWTCLGHVNIVATAAGKIIPSARIKQIQPLEKGVVKTIFVQEGSKVKQGEPLVELDSTITTADQQRLTNELLQSQFSLARFQALQKMLENSEIENSQDVAMDKNIFSAIENAGVTDIALQEQLLQQQWRQYLAQRSATESALESHKAAKQEGLEIIKKLQGTLPLITKRTDSIKGLMDKQMASEADYLELEEQRITQQQDLAAQQANQKQLDAAIEQAQQELNALTARTHSETLDKMAELQRQVKVNQEELSKARDLKAKQILYAPVNGRVQGLVANTIGGVVSEAQQLMTIVPEGENLEVEVFLQNKDIGFVHEGDAAEIKIQTFPFTKYGVINATVTRLSNDAFSLEKNQRDPSQNEGLVYTMGLRMEKSTIQVNGEDVILMPGMAVTAEVKTGERRIIEFFLSPMLKAQQESIRER